MTLDDLNDQVRKALGAHAEWKMKLKRAAAKGSLEVPAADVKRDDLCTFGKWLKDIADDPDVKGTEGFESVRAKHAAFHAAAGDVAAKIEAGHTDAASAALNGDAYTGASEQLASALYEWKASA